MASGRATTIYWMDSYPGVYEQHKLGNIKVGWGERCDGSRRSEEEKKGMNKIKIHYYMKLSKN